MENHIFGIAAITVLGSSITLSTPAMGITILNFSSGGVGVYGFVNSGSYFAIDTNRDDILSLSERISMESNNGFKIGSVQTASGSHSDTPGCVPIGITICNNSGEFPGIDAAWNLFGNTGMHLTTSAPVVISNSGDTAQIGMTGWAMIWNGIPNIINLGAGITGSLVCAAGSNCAAGSAFTLDYNTIIPADDPSGLGNIGNSGSLVEKKGSADNLSAPSSSIEDGTAYTLHLEGFLDSSLVSNVPVPASAWLFGSGLLGLMGIARRKIR